MNKARIITPEVMTEEQIREDVSMSPLERLDLAFQLSDFALDLQRNHKTIKEESASIQWIELHKIPS